MLLRVSLRETLGQRRADIIMVRGYETWPDYRGFLCHWSRVWALLQTEIQHRQGILKKTVLILACLSHLSCWGGGVCACVYVWIFLLLFVFHLQRGISCAVKVKLPIMTWPRSILRARARWDGVFLSAEAKGGRKLRWRPPQTAMTTNRGCFSSNFWGTGGSKRFDSWQDVSDPDATSQPPMLWPRFRAQM